MSSDGMSFTYTVPPDDFLRAGEVSTDVKNKLKSLGIAPDIIRRVSIAMYEGEINMVIHANGGEIEVEITPQAIQMVLKDQGPGIADVDLAMKEGFTTATDSIRNLGFGAGMGLSNMKRHTDCMEIESIVGKGTTVKMTVNL